jgi:hypothetical protein
MKKVKELADVLKCDVSLAWQILTELKRLEKLDDQKKKN